MTSICSLFVWSRLVVNDRKFLAGTVFFSHTNQLVITSLRTSNDINQPIEHADDAPRLSVLDLRDPSSLRLVGWPPGPPGAAQWGRRGVMWARAELVELVCQGSRGPDASAACFCLLALQVGGPPGKPSGLIGQDERTDDAVPFSRWKRRKLRARRACICVTETFLLLRCSSFSVTARHGFLCC